MEGIFLSIAGTIASFASAFGDGQTAIGNFIRAAARNQTETQDPQQGFRSPGLPAPVEPIVRPLPAPVGGVAAAPAFEGAAARILGLGGAGAIIFAEVLTRSIERIQEARIARELEEQDEGIRQQARRRARDRELAEVIISGGIGGVERVDPIPAPTRPGVLPELLPEILFPRPALPERVPFPEIAPPTPAPSIDVGTVVRPSLPARVAETVPSVREFGTQVAGVPARTPELLPDVLSIPLLLSRLRVGDPVAAVTEVLTPVQSPVLPSQASPVTPTTLPFAARLTQGSASQGTRECPPPRRCKKDDDDERLECFKGLYRESAFDTEFTPWAEVSCLTGREI